MSRRKNRNTVAAPPQASRASIVVLALLAGAVGASVTWSLLPARPTASSSTPPPAATQADTPPNVANLPPAQAALLLGHWHYDHQRWPTAAEKYETALRLGIDNPDIRTDLGNCFRFLGQPEKAREQYETSRIHNPQHEKSLYNLATLYVQVFHDNAKARELLNEYLRHFPASEGAPRARQFLSEITNSKLSPDADRLLRALATDPNLPAK